MLILAFILYTKMQTGGTALMYVPVELFATSH